MDAESSEKLPCDGSLDPNDGPVDPNDASFGSERIAVASSEDFAEVVPLNEAEDVIGYLDKENATLVLESVESQKIKLSGNCLKFSQGSDEKLYLYASPEHTMEYPSIEHAVSQTISENSGNIHTFLMQCDMDNVQVSNAGIEMTGKNDGLQNFEKNEMYSEQAHMNSNSNLYSSEALDYHTEEEEEDTTEMVFIPTTSKVISVSNNSGYLHLSGVVHPTGVVSKFKKEWINCSRKINKESVIVSEEHADSHSNKMVDGVRAMNKENNNSLHEHMAFEVETSSPTVEENSSVFVPPQDIDPTVSIIHTTTTCDQDEWTKSIQMDKSQAEETSHPDITLPAVTNITYLECKNLKESVNSELSENSLIDKSRNHSNLKCGTDSSNNDTLNCEASTVKEIVDESTNESCELPCGNIADDYSKQKHSINCNNDSNTSVDFDQSQNLGNKMFAPSSKNCENEMAFTNSEEVCSEIQACTERTSFSLEDSSDSKSSFFSGSSWSKDHNLHMLKKSKSDDPSKLKIMDEYNFEDSSSNLSQELNCNSSLDWQHDKVNSNDISTEVDATKVSQSMNFDHTGETGNLTFKGMLTPVTDDTKLNENLDDSRHSEIFDNSQYLFDQGPQHKENSSSKMSKSTIVEFCRNEQNSAINVDCSNENTRFDRNILPVKNVNVDISKENNSLILNITAAYETIVNSQRTYSEGKRTDSAKSLHQTLSQKKRNSNSNRNIELFSGDFSDDESYPMQDYFCGDNEKEQVMCDEYGVANEDGYVNLMPSCVKNRINAKGFHPVDEQTPATVDCLEKIPNPVLNTENSVSACGMNFDNKSKENSVFSNVDITDETAVKPPLRTYGRKRKASYPTRNIELFSDDLFDSEPYSTPKIDGLDNERKQIVIDEYGSADEDGYINLMAPRKRNKISSLPVDESAISLKSESSDLNLLENDSDLAMDAENSVDIHYMASLMETSFNPTCTEITDGIVPKVSSPDVPKAVSLKSSLEKEMQTPSCEKSAQIDSFKSRQVQDKMIKRKISEKVQMKKKKTQNSENSNCSSTSIVHKKGKPTKDGERSSVNVGERSSVNVGERSSVNVGERSSNVGERSSNVGERSSNVGERSSNVGERIRCTVGVGGRCKYQSLGLSFCHGGYVDRYRSRYQPSTSASTEECIDFQYKCLDCEFASNRVNNLVAHVKYKACRKSADQIRYMGKRQGVPGKFSGRLSNYSIAQKARLPTSSKKAFHKASNHRPNNPSASKKPRRRQ